MFEFLHKLFPIDSLYNLNPNTLTAWWVLLTVTIFIIAVFRFTKNIFKLKKTIKKVLINSSFEDLRKNHLLNIQWLKYNHTFLKLSEDEYKTGEDAQDFFNLSEVLNQSTSAKLYEALPGILVGIGILGTFVGLTVGISFFDTSSAESIKDSIQTLLSGMGTAFISSVWGMGLSILFLFLEKGIYWRVSKDSMMLCNLLDEKFKLKKHDISLLIKKEQQELFNKYFTFSIDDNKIVYPADVFRRLIIESEQQTKSLKSFSTDLADGIKISTETVMALGNNLGNVVSDSLKMEFKPVLDNLNSAIDQLLNVKEESSAKVIETIISNVNDTLKNVVDKFQTTLSQNTTVEIENLASTVQKASESFYQLPDMIGAMMNDFKQAISLQQNSLKDTSSFVNTEVATAISLMRSEVENVSATLKQNIESIQNGMSGLLSNQKNNIGYVDELISKSNEVFINGDRLSQKLYVSIGAISDTFENIKILSSALLESKNTIDKTSQILLSNSNMFKNEIESFIRANKELLSQHLSAIQQSQNSNIELSNRYSMINKEINEIFPKIQSGLINYQQAVKDSIQSYLGDFSTHLQSAAESLNGSIELLRDGVDDLNDIFDKTSKVR